MPSINYVFGTNTITSAYGHFIKSFDGKPALDPGIAINALFERFQKLQTLHANYTINDAQIVGMERSRLLDATDEIILVVVLLIMLFSKKQTIEFPEDENFPATMALTFNPHNWTLQGYIPLSTENMSFKTFNEKNLLPDLKVFLNEYKTASADKIITDTESKKIVKSLRDIFYSLLNLYYLLYHLQINS